MGTPRIYFTDENEDGEISHDVDDGEVLQEGHFYPFGMNHEGDWLNVPDDNSINPYGYNGKEFNNDGGIDLLDYGARYYDASVGWFMSVDPLAEKYAFQSPYAYAANDPIRYVDVKGLGPGDPVETKSKELITSTFSKCTTYISSVKSTFVTETNNKGVVTSIKTTTERTHTSVDSDGNISNISKATSTTTMTNTKNGPEISETETEHSSVSLESTSDSFQDIVVSTSDAVIETGLLPIEQKAISNATEKDAAEIVGGISTGVGGILNFIPHPNAQWAGKGKGLIGVGAYGVSSTTETNPYKIVNRKFK